MKVLKLKQRYGPDECLAVTEDIHHRESIVIHSQSVVNLHIARTASGKADPICYDFVDDIQYLVKAYKKRCTTYRKNGCYFVER